MQSVRVTSRVRRATRGAHFFALVIAAAGVGVGCAQILGADEPRDLALAVNADDGGVQTFDAIAVVPDARDPNACAPTEKRCDGICVSKGSPDYGCASEACTPCSVPNALQAKCTENGEDKCAFALCKPGWLACGASTDGCTDENSSPQSCGGCGTACGGQFPACTSTGCAASCPDATTNCSNSCVDTEASPSHCGGCGKNCPSALNGDPECEKAKCLIACRPGFAHCDGNPTGDCVALTPFYRDLDGDGAGDASQKKLACNAAEAGAGWVIGAGDCHDGNPEVFPLQRLFFGVPYLTKSSALSYDYDCNGVEVETPGVTHFPGCGTQCSGSGLAPVNSLRVGPGVNDYCGSGKVLTCGGGATPMQPMAVTPKAGPTAEKPISCSTAAVEVPAHPCH